ncbi:MAG: threonylcarbamoyl-AMP synthase [Saprospiraceae bacterium]|nr:threonylcarbamoyl-AMP synthase [Saprospiraceae bacterium]MCB9323325.1 threonylcarbamoyl-AMP synthase [Lewinellaceae bacterium]
MLLRINPDNPEGRKIKQVVEVLRQGGVIIYPTDTVYGLGCDIFQQKAVDRICHLRGINPEKARLSFICKDIADISEYTTQIDNQTFKLLKKNLPGPFTFVLKSGNKLPKIFKNNKKTIGIRIPKNNIVTAIIEELGHPMMTSSLKSDDELLEYFTDPIDIYEDFKKRVDLVIDGGIGGNIHSTVVDCTEADVEIIREGAGELMV